MKYGTEIFQNTLGTQVFQPQVFALEQWVSLCREKQVGPKGSHEAEGGSWLHENNLLFT